MDVIFEMENGYTFSIEVGFFDTILEFKEKVEKYQGIPIANQTLMLNGEVLKDDDDVWKVEILQNTRIQLHVSLDTKIHVNVKLGSCKTVAKKVEIDAYDTVLRLKERIHELGNALCPVDRMRLRPIHYTREELQDHQVLRDCDVSDGSDIVVTLRPPNTSGPKKVGVWVLPKAGARKVPMEVNPNDNVEELRKELHKCSERYQIHFPAQGDFFILGQDVMDDHKSFLSHGVKQGDTIEMFPGRVTKGS